MAKEFEWDTKHLCVLKVNRIEARNPTRQTSNTSSPKDCSRSTRYFEKASPKKICSKRISLMHLFGGEGVRDGAG